MMTRCQKLQTSSRYMISFLTVKVVYRQDLYNKLYYSAKLNESFLSKGLVFGDFGSLNLSNQNFTIFCSDNFSIMKICGSKFCPVCFWFGGITKDLGKLLGHPSGDQTWERSILSALVLLFSLIQWGSMLLKWRTFENKEKENKLDSAAQPQVLFVVAFNRRISKYQSI